MSHNFDLSHHQDYWAAKFDAMASPCELLIDTDSRQQATVAGQIAQKEAQRVEQKFSRYRSDNIIFRINHAEGKAIEVDDETAHMLDYAALCFELSDGLFDVTSGILRRVWKFDGSDRLPQKKEVEALVELIGWQKLNWQRPMLQMPAGMEIDLGGIGKEYAVDRTGLLLNQAGIKHCLINYGGDLLALGPRRDGQPWLVGMDRLDPQQLQSRRLRLEQGALTTSGDTRRYLIKDSVRYSHILNPKTGWPVPDAPRTVTVHAPSCLEAGMLSTFAMLQGKDAETFLENQGVKYWVQR